MDIHLYPCFHTESFFDLMDIHLYQCFHPESFFDLIDIHLYPVSLKCHRFYEQKKSFSYFKKKVREREAHEREEYKTDIKERLKK